MSPRAALGLRAQRGGAVVVAVAAGTTGPRLLYSTFLATAADGDRLALEPYHVAAEIGRRAEAEAAVAEGRSRQAALASEGLGFICRSLEAKPSVAALLVNRAGWVTDLLAYSLAFADHPPVAEGLAVRDALRAACAGAGIAIEEMDEKSLPERASQALGLSTEEIDASLEASGSGAGRPWRKEQKIAFLAAWTAVAGR